VTLNAGSRCNRNGLRVVYGVENGRISTLWSATRKKHHVNVLAAPVTSPQNHRFPSGLVVNHLWNRLMGAGIVNLVSGLGGKTGQPSRKLLQWLGRRTGCQRFTTCVHVLQLMMTSENVPARNHWDRISERRQRQRFFQRSRSQGELDRRQVVDFPCFTRQPVVKWIRGEVDVQSATGDPSPSRKRATLGKPSRAWMFAGLHKKRDRPEPIVSQRAQPIADVLEAFGWTDEQQPIAGS